MAKTLLVLAVVALAAGLVAAECPNACSGHGVCQSYRDFCQCYKGFQGNDCSQRTCPFGLSFIDTPQGDLNHDNVLTAGFGDRAGMDPWTRPTGTPNLTALNPMWRPDGWWENHPSQLYGVDDQGSTLPMRARAQEGHFYAECSNRGLCNRETGECECFTSYEGTACNRTVCANGCSGHGTCESVREQLPSDSDYMLWDSDKSMGCVCDPEYFGNDCAKRRCYRNDDPLTSDTTNMGVSEKLVEQGETQVLRVACGNNGDVDATSTIALTYTDVQFGEQYTTGTFLVTASDATILALLRALPNQILGSSQGVTDSQDYNKVVSVTADHTENINGGNVYRWNIVFHKSLGNVPTLTAVTTGQVCKAGWALPASYKSADWHEHIGVTLIGAGPLADVLVTFTVATDDGTNADTYTYRIEYGGAHAVESGSMQFESGAAYIDHPNGAGGTSALGDLFPVQFTFPLGGDAGTQLRTATSTYKIQFYAPTVATTVSTPQFTNSATLPISYQLSGRSGLAEELYIEYASPWVTHWQDETYTITITDATHLTRADLYSWSASYTGNSQTNQTAFDGWSTLGNCAGLDCYLKFRFEHGDGQGNERAISGAVFTVAAMAGKISSSGTADEVATLSWNSASYPSEAAKIIVTWIATDGTQDRYQWSYNGVNMGEYAFTAAAAALGGTGSTELAELRIAFADGAVDAGRGTTGQVWNFQLLQLPIQAVWSYQETLRVHFSDSASTSGNQVTVANNLAIVINMVDVSSNPDTYRWKVASDETWSSTYSFGAVPAQLGGASSHALWSASLQYMLFDFSGGVDSALRACDSTTNSYYYVQIGQEGINDFPTCSDRGICDEETGECKCFKGYAGQDCHEQHALSL